MKKIVLLLLISFVLLGLWFISGAFVCQKITCLSFNDINKYKIKQVYEESNYIFRGLYANGDMLLRTEIRPNSSLEETAKAIEFQIARTESVFEDAAAPYPGEISKVISCGAGYKPVRSMGGTSNFPITYFKYFVNERLIPGSCTNEQIAYHDTLAMFFCKKQKKFYQIEFLVPTKEYEINQKEYQSVLNSITCKD